MTPRALLLDLDNTLADRDAAFAAWLGALVPEGDVPRLTALDGGGYAPKGPFFAALSAASGHSPADLRRRFDHDFPACFTLRPDADALLSAFAGPKVLVTNGWSRLQRNKIAALGIAERLDAILVSGEVGADKPAPAIFLEALVRAGVAAEHALMVGDHPVNDIAGARGVGIPAVFVRSPWFEAPAGVPAVHSLLELPWLAGGRA